MVVHLTGSIAPKIQSKEIVMLELNNEIRFREPTIMDNKTFTFFRSSKNTKNVSFTSKNHKYFVGKWKVEQEGDWFILTEKISQ